MNRLKELRLKHEKTQQEIAAFLNVTPKAVSFYELGQRDIPNETLQKLANYFHVSTDYLLGRDIGLYKIHDTNCVPLIGTVRCGVGGVACEYIDEYITIDDSYRADEIRGFRAEGDSMEPEIHDGDICLVHLQDEVHDGALAVVVICNGAEDCEGTIKRIHKADGTVILQATNPAYPPRVFTGENANNVRSVGRVVEVRHKPT